MVKADEKARRTLKLRKAKEHAVLTELSTMYNGFVPEYHWWELVNFFKKQLLVGALGILGLGFGSTAHLVCATCVAFLFALLQSRFVPRCVGIPRPSWSF